MWVIGVDEKANAVVGAPALDPATWWSSTSSKFNERAPDLIHTITIPRGAVSVVAIVFDTEAAPFVVSNPSGGHISLEVPWREGTAIRSARRSDLVRLLAPASHLPEAEVLSARVTVMESATNEGDDLIGYSWHLTMTAFVHGEGRLEVPLHRIRVEIDVPVSDSGAQTLHLSDVGISDSGPGRRFPSIDAPPEPEPYRTVQTFPGLAVIDGAGRIRISASASVEPTGLVLSGDVVARVFLETTRSRGRTVLLSESLPEFAPASEHYLAAWEFRRESRIVQ